MCSGVCISHFFLCVPVFFFFALAFFRTCFAVTFLFFPFFLVVVVDADVVEEEVDAEDEDEDAVEDVDVDFLLSSSVLFPYNLL